MMNIVKDGIVEEFINWFHSRGEYYAKLSVKFYMDGEPYFSDAGAECSLRDYLRVKEENKDRFRCYYISGGGTEFDGGIWLKKETNKQIIFTLIDKPFFDIPWNKLVIHKDRTKNKRHCFKDWQDGTYTIYPNQCGTPYIFEPILLFK